MRNKFAAKLFEIAKKDKDVVLVIGDLGYGVLTKFWEELPNQFINAGISEQNMMSLAAGLALEGKKVFVYSIANFPTLRPLEQIRNDICYHNANVKIVSVGGGFAYGSLGMSHHGTEDIAIMRALPNMRVYSPCDSLEAIAITSYEYTQSSPCYLRLGKGGEADVHSHLDKITDNRAVKISSGNNKNTVVFASGAIIQEAIMANQVLKKSGLDTDIYSFACIKPIDTKTIISCCKKFKKIITLEEHNVIGGLGGAVAEVVAEVGGATLRRIGLQDCYSSVVGSQAYLRKIYEMNSEAVIREVSRE